MLFFINILKRGKDHENHVLKKHPQNSLIPIWSSSSSSPHKSTTTKSHKNLSLRKNNRRIEIKTEGEMKRRPKKMKKKFREFQRCTFAEWRWRGMRDVEGWDEDGR
jgi:hypothetical protein